MCLLDNREVRKGWDSLKDAIAGLFTKHGAKVLSNRRWDERRLAYPIDGQIRATYLLLYFSMDTQAIPALRRDLQFSEPMLRYMITDCVEVPADAYEPEAEFDINSIPEDEAPKVEAAAPKVEDAPAKEAAAEGADKAEDGSAEGTDKAEDGSDSEAGPDGADSVKAEKAEGDTDPVADAATTDGEENK